MDLLPGLDVLHAARSVADAHANDQAGHDDNHELVHQLDQTEEIVQSLELALTTLDEHYSAEQATVAENSVVALGFTLPRLEPSIWALERLGETEISGRYHDLTARFEAGAVRATPYRTRLHTPKIPTKPRTGDPGVDDGLACERPSGADQSRCVLSKDERRILIHDLQGRIDRATANEATAIQNARIDQIVTDDEGSEWLMNVLFGMTAVGALGILGSVAAEIAQLAIKADAPGLESAATAIHGKHGDSELIHKVLETGAHKVIDAGLEGAAEALEGDEEPEGAMTMDASHHGKAAFLARVQEIPPQLAQAICESAPALLDDLSLIALFEGYDIKHHSVAKYRAKIDDLLARYDKAEIGKVGVTESDAMIPSLSSRLDSATVRVGNHTRRALVRYRGAHGDWGLRPEFVRFLDADLADAADAKTRVGQRERLEAAERSEHAQHVFSGKIAISARDQIDTDVPETSLRTFDITDGWDVLDPSGSETLTAWRAQALRST